MKIVFFGTPEFSAAVLQNLLQHGIEVVAVVTKPDRPKGRSGEPVPTPVKEIAQAHHPRIPVYQPELVSAAEFAQTLAPYQADLFVVVAYGEIIKQHLLDMPKLGCINVHTSLLPKHRGAAPIQYSIMKGDSVTGVTVMFMDKKMDTGDIIKKVEVAIDPNAAFPEIEAKLCQVGAEALIAVIGDFASGKVQRHVQDHSQATYSAKIELEDCELKWDLPAKSLHDLVRAMKPNPGAWCYVFIKGQKKRLKINQTEVLAERSGLPGEILAYGKDGFIVACGEQALKILELQLEGKKPMKSEELMRGIPREGLAFLRL